MPIATTTPYSNGSWSEGKVVNNTNVGGGTFSRTTPTPRVDPDKVVAPSADTSKLGVDPATGVDLETLAYSNRAKEQNNASRNADTLTRYTQGIVDSLNSKYLDLTGRQKTVNAATDARAYALNSSRGLTDSGTGAAALNVEQEKGKGALDRLDTMKQAEISAALGKSESLRENLEKQAQAQVANDEKGYKDAVASNKKDAIDILTSFGKGDIDMESLKTKEPNTYASLKKALGYSDLEMAAKYNSVKTNPIKYQYKIQGDTVTAYGVGPDGKLSVLDETVPGLASGQFEIKETKDGSLYKLNKTTGDITPLHGAGPGKPTPQTTYSKNEEVDAKNWLALQAGFDKDLDLKKFEDDPQFKAFAIQQAQAAKKSSKSTNKSTTTDHWTK